MRTTQAAITGWAARCSVPDGAGIHTGAAANATSAARAARLLAASEASYEASGIVMDPDDRQTFEQSVALVQGTLTEAEFQVAWAEGRAMSVERAVDDALHGEERDYKSSHK